MSKLKKINQNSSYALNHELRFHKSFNFLKKIIQPTKRILDLGPENLAKMRIKLMNKDYSQFDKLFMAVCSDFSSEIICLTEEAGKFPDHKFVLFENILHGKKREELHYILGSSADSVEKY